ncbi:methyltransferase domain-containing protein [Ktedonosporobacter rubrisoli]|nr:methyltransferase domain-containing protein [Ktedonosporobacter rubrisoli]
MESSAVSETIAECAQLVQEIEQQLGRALQEPVREAFLMVPRHVFVSQYYKQKGSKLEWDLVQASHTQIYRDEPLVTQIDRRGMPSSSSSQPSVMVLQLEALDLQEGQRILEIGTGTGYNAALMGRLVGKSGTVVSIDIDDGLVEEAKRHLFQAGSENVIATVADGYEGYAPLAPYERVIATCGLHRVPRCWLAQLRPGALLVANILLELVSPIIRVKQVGTQTLKGSFLPLEDVRYMPMRQHGEEPASRQGMRWKKYNELPRAEVELAGDLEALLKQAGFALLLHCLVPTVSSHYRWQEGDEQPKMYLLNDRSGETAIQVLGAGTVYAYRDAEDLLNGVRQAMRVFEQLGAPALDRFQVTIEEVQTLIEVDDQVFSLPI